MSRPAIPSASSTDSRSACVQPNIGSGHAVQPAHRLVPRVSIHVSGRHGVHFANIYINGNRLSFGRGGSAAEAVSKAVASHREWVRHWRRVEAR